MSQQAYRIIEICLFKNYTHMFKHVCQSQLSMESWCCFHNPRQDSPSEPQLLWFQRNWTDHSGWWAAGSCLLSTSWTNSASYQQEVNIPDSVRWANKRWKISHLKGLTSPEGAPTGGGKDQLVDVVWWVKFTRDLKHVITKLAQNYFSPFYSKKEKKKVCNIRYLYTA